MIILENKQIEAVKSLSINGRWSEYTDIDYNIKLWSKFWTKVYVGEKSDVILDFGSGATWGGCVAEKLGFTDHVNLDIDIPEVREKFGLYASALNQNVTYYNGFAIPFSNDHFNSIVAKASIMKLDKTDLHKVVEELLRVSKSGAIWYIASKGMCFRLKEALVNENIAYKLTDKNIDIKCWTWFPLEFNRSKTPFTEFYTLYKAVNFFRKIKKLLKNR